MINITVTPRGFIGWKGWQIVASIHGVTVFPVHNGGDSSRLWHLDTIGM